MFLYVVVYDEMISYPFSVWISKKSFNPTSLRNKTVHKLAWVRQGFKVSSFHGSLD